LVGARSLLRASSRAAITLKRFFALVHVNEVDDDDAAQVTQANLAHDLRHRVEVGFDDGVLKPRRLADVLAGIDVDGHQGFRLVDDDGAAGLEPDLGAEGLRDFILNAEVLEKRVSLVYILTRRTRVGEKRLRKRTMRS